MARGSRRTVLSPIWSDPEGSSHNDFVPGRRLPPNKRPSAAKQHEEPANAGRPAAQRTGPTARIYSAPACDFFDMDASLRWHDGIGLTKPSSMTDDESPGLGLDLPEE